jgi:hypothetical protein
MTDCTHAERFHYPLSDPGAAGHGCTECDIIVDSKAMSFNQWRQKNGWKSPERGAITLVAQWRKECKQ